MAVGQIALGSLAMLAVLVVGIGGASALGSDELGVAAVLAGPLAGGGIVCGIGSTSNYYQGGCGAPIAGAYLGALTAIPLAIVGCKLDDSSGELGCIGGALLGFLAGYMVGTAGGATLAWHMSKRPRVAPAHALVALPPVAPRAAGPSLGGPRLTVPLLALQF